MDRWVSTLELTAPSRWLLRSSRRSWRYEADEARRHCGNGRWRFMLPPDSTAAIILAAGASRRMGRNKMLLELEGVPLVRRAVACALAAGLSPVVVVVGHEADPVRSALAGL